MLFGLKLKNETRPQWKEHYIDYDHLKKLLNENGVGRTWTEQNELTFAGQLDKELEKVFTFQSEQYHLLDEAIEKLEQQNHSWQEMSAESRAKVNFKKFQDELEKELSFAQELEHFARLNFTGFLKIVKKHDRLHKKYSVKAMLNVRLKTLPFHDEDYSPYLYRLSILYQNLRESFNVDSSSLSKSLTTPSSTSRSGRSDSTQTLPNDDTFKVFKFWIDPDDLMETKATVLRHLPVLVYNESGHYDDQALSDPRITSLYFENKDFELYNSNVLNNMNQIPRVRITWSGRLSDHQDLAVEKKTFNYDTGEADDIKVQLKEKYINDFIALPKEEEEEHVSGLLAESQSKRSGKPFNCERYVKKLQKRGSTPGQMEQYAQDFQQLQKFIVDNKLQPTFRTIYKRTAFEIPGDSKVRIRIDSDMIFIREDSLDEDRPIRDPQMWHRKDLDSTIEDPELLLRQGEFYKFPFAVMEVRVGSSVLQNTNSKTAKWVGDLMNSHLVKDVPKFSKFIQGIASLYLEDENLDVLPYWLPDLETDIRKSPEQAYAQGKSRKDSHLEIARKLKNALEPNSPTRGGFKKPENAELNRILEQNDDEDANAASQDSSDAESSPETYARDSRGSSTRSDPRLENKLTGYESEEDEVLMPASVKKPQQLLRQSGPVKVEAKVWLANERTFNRWLSVCSMLSSLTFIIYSSVSKANYPTVATDLAYIYFGLTIFAGLWGYYVFHKRLGIIRNRSEEHLDAVTGPVIVGVVLMISLTINFFAGFKRVHQDLQMVTTAQVLQTQNLSPFNRFLLEKVSSVAQLL